MADSWVHDALADEDLFGDFGEEAALVGSSEEDGAVDEDLEVEAALSEAEHLMAQPAAEVPEAQPASASQGDATPEAGAASALTAATAPKAASAPEAASGGKAASAGKKSRRKGPAKGEAKPAGEKETSAEASRPVRSLKRRGSLGKPDGLKCESRLCLWGGALKAPAVIHPLVKRSSEAGDRLYLPVHERLFWLRRACGDKGQTHWTERFQHAVSELRRLLRDRIAEQVDAVRFAAEKLRESLGLEDEDGASAGKPAKRRLHLPPSVEQVCVALGESRITVRVHERPFEIEATPEAVMAVIQYCQERLRDDPILLKKDQRRAAAEDEAPEEEGSAASASASASAPASASAAALALASDAAGASAASSATKGAFCLGASSCPAILGKVTWHPSVKAWAVHFKDADKKAQTKRVPVRLLKVLKAGTFLDDASAESAGERWAAQRRAAYQEAVGLWNRLDCSKRDRIELEEAAGTRL